MKKLILIISCVFFVNVNAFEKLDKIVLSGPIATVSHPLVHMAKSGALNDIAKKVEFKLWSNPDELRALVLKNQVDFVAVPSTVGANLYNKGVDIKLVNISIWGILNMIVRDPKLKTLADLKGKEIIVPFRADMPDIVFNEVAKKQGFNPKKDFKLRYVANPIDAMKLLLTRRADNVLLVEPATSMVINKSKSFPINIIAPDLYRGANLQEEWGKVFNVEPKIPQAGIAVLGNIMKDKFVMQRFQEEYEKSTKWYKNNPKKAGKMIEKSIKMLNAQGVADSIPYVQLEVVTAKNSQKDLEFFYNILKASSPKSIGGKLPNDGFYYK